MKIIFFVGKGGVGKSTLSSITAFKLSLMNKKVHLLSIDPAHNLNDIFSKNKKLESELNIEEVDIDKWTNDYIKNIKGEIKSEYKYLSSLNIDNLVDIISYSPGIQEYAILKAFSYIIKKYENYDYIIFDTPPTALTLRILTLPEISVRWTQKLMEIRQKILSRRLSIANVYGDKDYNKKYGNFAGYKKEDDKVYKKLENMLEENKWLNKIFKDKKITYIVPILNQDTLSFKETKRIVEYLNKFKISIPFFILNKFSGKQESENRLYNEFKKDVYTLQQKEDDYFIDTENFNNVTTDYIEKYFL